MEIKFNLPKIKPIWVAWVTAQSLLGAGIASAADPGWHGTVGLIIAGIMLGLDCFIASGAAD